MKKFSMPSLLLYLSPGGSLRRIRPVTALLLERHEVEPESAGKMFLLGVTEALSLPDDSKLTFRLNEVCNFRTPGHPQRLQGNAELAIAQESPLGEEEPEQSFQPIEEDIQFQPRQVAAVLFATMTDGECDLSEDFAPYWKSVGAKKGLSLYVYSRGALPSGIRKVATRDLSN